MHGRGGRARASVGSRHIDQNATFGMTPVRSTRALVRALTLTVVVLVGCSERDPSAIRFGLQSAVQTLDPRYATDAASTRLCRLLYQPLVDFADDYQPVAALASWRRLSPRHYRFTLDAQRAPFHGGQRVTSRDVVATYEHILDAANASPHRGSLDMIDAVEAIDDDTLDFRLSRSDALFPGRLTVGILPAAQIAGGRDFSTRPMGSGPFALHSWPEPERLVIERRDDGLKVEFLRVRRADVRVLKLLRGEIDLVQGDMPPELLGWLEQRPEVEVRSVPGTTFAYVGFNLQDPVVGDPRVRRAIALGIDRAAIIHHIFAANARRAGGILTPDHWAGHPDIDGVEFDPQAARDLLTEAGYVGKNRPRIVYKTSTNPVRVRIASVIQDQLAHVGIDVEVRTYDWGTFYGDIKAGNFQMYSLAWVGIKMPDIFRYVFHSASVPPVGANRGRFMNDAVDELIDAAEASPDLGQRTDLYRSLQQRVLNELPYVPLWYEDQVLVTRRDIVGYRLAGDGNYDGLNSIRRRSRTP